MQERYLGDIHDFYKFNFLKFLSKKLNEKIGLNWYLVDPKKIGNIELIKNDGENRRYLTRSKYLTVDSELIKEMQSLRILKNRKLEKFTKDSHLKYFIDFYNEKLCLSNRELWFTQSLNFFQKNSLVFLDPDNGFGANKTGPGIRAWVFIIKGL